MLQVWQLSTNKIPFTNSYKMKMSIVLGVMQMLFGVFLSLWNHRFFHNSVSIFCEFIPQLIFLCAIFGYLVVIIFAKWTINFGKGTYCAPSLLITLINMFLFSYPTEPCYQAQFYSGQQGLQCFLVVLAVICIPWILLAKPLLLRHRHLKSHGGHDGDGEFDFGDTFINQTIHTIEYCLGSVSHTASYLRLWALSLAHAQLSEVLWNMVLRFGLQMDSLAGGLFLYLTFAAWAFLTMAVLLVMEGLSAFLHALRLHWWVYFVEFQQPFADGARKHPFALL
ncbi:hypothetical protein HPB47_023617 [Ixodes persulcatus]|uniref:Uncharacterized protein n=1 Tax=Ixodes persulcatus TaxID=34615 RepID=A0AC60Q709_IXOPE|nr:hypothetical protein HPB47_023617 [Ixodes persulcatus]